MTLRAEVRAAAGASVSNLCCGIDVLGLALEGPRDVVTARPAARPGVRLAEIRGDGGRLPREEELNTCSVAARALLAAAGVEKGVELTLDKGLPLASGLGSSAASAVAAVVAVDALLGLALPPGSLLAAAVEAERVASGAAHPDNAAPSLLGGIVLARSADPLEVVRLPVPRDLAVAVARPALELPTREGRALLPPAIPWPDAVAQWGNLAALVAALFREDWQLLGRCLEDRIAEPRRTPRVPGFAAAKAAGLAAGAVGVGLSGSGPSVFALCRGLPAARAAGEAMAEAFQREAGLASDVLASQVAARGARLLAAE
jgi:homoserine kinase